MGFWGSFFASLSFGPLGHSGVIDLSIESSLYVNTVVHFRDKIKLHGGLKVCLRCTQPQNVTQIVRLCQLALTEVC